MTVFVGAFAVTRGPGSPEFENRVSRFVKAFRGRDRRPFQIIAFDAGRASRENRSNPWATGQRAKTPGVSQGRNLSALRLQRTHFWIDQVRRAPPAKRPPGLFVGMLLSRSRMLVGLLAMLVSGCRMMLGFIVLAAVVMRRRLMVVMRCSMVMAGGFMVVFARRMFC
jgi:hypothetical protein